MSFMILLGKEFKEIVRTRRIIVLPAVFLFFGILSPALLHLTPQLLKSQGLNITMPPPEPWQSAGEYFEAATMFGAVALILVAMGAVAEEKVKGSVHMVLSKPVRRSHFLLAKFISLASLSTLSLFLGAVACLYYTNLLIGTLPLASYLGSILLLALFLVFVTSLTILFSSILGSQIAAGGATIALFFASGFLPVFGGIFKTASPHVLVGLSNQMLLGQTEKLAVGLGANVVLIFLIMAVAWFVFSRQEL